MIAPSRHSLLWCCLVACLLLGFPLEALRAAPSRAPQQRQDDLSTSLDKDKIEQALARIEADPTSFGGEAQTKTIKDIYLEARASLEQANRSQLRVEELRKAIEATPTLAASIRAELSVAPTKSSPQSTADSTVTEMEAEQSLLNAQLRDASTLVAELENEELGLGQKLTEIAGEMATIGSQKEEVDSALSGLINDSGELVSARLVQYQARQLELRERLGELEVERDFYTARSGLIPLLRDQAARRQTHVREQTEALQELLSARRASDLRGAVTRAEELAAEFSEQVLIDLAQDNETWAGEAEPGSLAELESEIASKRRQLSELRQRFLLLREKLSISGWSDMFAAELRREYERVPNSREFQRRQHELSKEVAGTGYRWTEYRRLYAAWSDVEVCLGEVQAQLAADVGAERAQQLELRTRELLENRVELLGGLRKGTRDMIDRGLELDGLLVELTRTTQLLRVFIEEHVLWLRSEFPRMPRLHDARDGMLWLLGFDNDVWGDGIRRSLSSFARPSMLGLCTLVLLLGLGRRLSHQRLKALAKRTGSFRTDSFGLTLLALFWTIYRGALLPATLYAVGVLLDTPDQNPNLIALSLGLRLTALVILPIAILHEHAAPNSLALSHFRIGREAVASINRVTNWALYSLTPLLIIALSFDPNTAGPDHRFLSSTGRIAFCAVVLVFGVCYRRLLNPTGAVMEEFKKRNPEGWVYRTRFLWFRLTYWIQLLFVGVALAGYYYTAFTLAKQLVHIFILVLVVLLVSELMHRYLFIVRRRLTVGQARERARAKMEAVKDGEAVTIDEDHLDIPAVDAQTRQLFRSGVFLALVVGVFMILADVLPALGIFERVQVWPKIELIAEADWDIPEDVGLGPLDVPWLPTSGLLSTPEAGAAEQGDVLPEEPTVITLKDLLNMGLLVVFMVIAARNVPGLLEMFLLQRLPIDGGTRYAITAIVRYVIVILGLTWALSAVGIGWGKVQWLAAALTFGLGFGLQEIFANFVSGLIILAERPIRIGDTVTIGGVEGIITKIRMRATAVTDYDRRELLVPNREFISNQLINWTLSDSISRIVVSVGVAYGSDTRLTEKLLMKAAADCELVLRTPAASVLFSGFGESSLDFRLRVFIANRDLWYKVTHDLHMRIDDMFREAGIEIAFPQRDLHVRSAKGLARYPELHGGERPGGEFTDPGLVVGGDA